MNSLVLIQHCQSQHHVNSQARLWPDTNNDLTDLGHRQAACMAKRLQKVLGTAPCVLYTSPMRRAAQTTEIIGQILGLRSRSVNNLREHNGHFAMERTADGEEWVIDESQWFRLDYRPFAGAETWREFHKRVSTTMEAIAGELQQARLVPVLVVHGGTLNSIVAWWLGMDLAQLPEGCPFTASPGSLTILRRRSRGHSQIERLNDLAHLYQAGLLSGLPVSF
ncbi:histidine phosphatase family protein [Candidatus Poribacteria bacterium]|nr:histidine phosphatase family protein [Candidatus Poribacteria bacterium]